MSSMTNKQARLSDYWSNKVEDDDAERMTTKAGEKRTWIEDSEEDDIVDVTGESRPKLRVRRGRIARTTNCLRLVRRQDSWPNPDPAQEDAW